MPPSAPPSVTGNFSAGTPTAPGAATGSFSAGTPTAPGAASGSFSAGTPTAPGAASGSFSAGTPTTPGAASGSYAAPTAGVPAVPQVLTLVVTGTSSAGGTQSAAVTPINFPNSWKGGSGSASAAVITGIVASDTVAQIAEKIRAQIGGEALTAELDWGDVFVVSGTGANVVLPRTEGEANAASAEVGLEDVTTVGVTGTCSTTTEGEAEVAGLDAPAAVTTDFS